MTTADRGDTTPSDSALPHTATPDGTLHDSTLRGAVRYLGELHGSIRRPVIALMLVGTAAGVVEAASLLMFVKAAVAITSDDVEPVDVFGIAIDQGPGGLLVGALVLAVLAAGLHALLARRSAQLSFQIGDRARSRLIDAFLDARWSHVAEHPEGRLQESMSHLVESTTRAAAHVALGASSVVILAALGVAAVATSPAVSLALIAIPALMLLTAGRPLRRLRERASADVRNSLSLSEAVAATATLAREYRTFGVQRQHASSLKHIAEQHGLGVMRTRIAGFTMSFLFKDTALISLIAVVALLYRFSDLREGAVIASVLIVLRMLGYLQQTVRLMQEGSSDAATIEALRLAILDLEAAREHDGHLHIDDIGTIEFAGVEYAYDGRGNALDGVDLTIEANTTLGLVGASGAGKSTLAEVLLGLRPPSAGVVTVNGVDLADIRRADWARLSAVVPQDQHLANVSIRDNIAFLRVDVSADDIRRAAERANVHDEIEQIPDGYDHVIGSRSHGLSGGQRQRVAIARALAGAPRLLILDEPTSALDAATEQRFRQTLDELHGTITIVVIAHRPATIEACDTVVRLEHGRVVEVIDGASTRSAKHAD